MSGPNELMDDGRDPMVLVAELKQQLAEALAALEPFARSGENFGTEADSCIEDDDIMLEAVKHTSGFVDDLTVGDFRRAREAFRALADSFTPARGESAGWRPIESAPIHEGVILYAPWPGGQPFRGEAVIDWDGIWKWADGTPVEPRNKPTHWMPLPDPPLPAPHRPRGEI